MSAPARHPVRLRGAGGAARRAAGSCRRCPICSGSRARRWRASRCCVLFRLAPPHRAGADRDAAGAAGAAAVGDPVRRHARRRHLRAQLPRARSAARAGLPGVWSLLLLAVGPLGRRRRSGRAGGVVFPYFLQAALLWAYYHLVRQHWGFVALYRRRAPDDPTPARLDEAFLWLGCLYPFVRFSLTPAFAASGSAAAASRAARPRGAPRARRRGRAGGGGAGGRLDQARRGARASAPSTAHGDRHRVPPRHLRAARRTCSRSPRR